MIISIMTSILNFTGLILSECILAYFIIILNGLVLNYPYKIPMRPMFLFDTGTTASDVLDARLLRADHVEHFPKVVAFFVALDVVDLLLNVHFFGWVWIFFII